MACGCGKKKTAKQVEGLNEMRTRGASREDIIAEATNSDEFIYAIYNGPKYPHLMRSATGVIADYGINDYGIGKRGDVIKVHQTDFQKSNGKLYLPISNEEIEKMAKQGIRTTGFINPNNFSAEAESNRVARQALDKQLKEMDHPNAYRSNRVAQEVANADADVETEDVQTRGTTEAKKVSEAQDGEVTSDEAKTPVPADGDVNSPDNVELTRAGTKPELATAPTPNVSWASGAEEDTTEATKGKGRTTKK